MKQKLAEVNYGIAQAESRWPRWCRRLVKWLVKVVLGYDVDRLASTAVSAHLKLMQLRACGVRVLQLQPAHAVEKSAEWRDLRDFLELRPKMPSTEAPGGQSKMKPAKPVFPSNHIGAKTIIPGLPRS